MPLFVEPGISAASQAAVWDASRPGDAVSIRRLAAQPQAKWLGDWNSDPYEDAHHYVTAAAASKALPVLTLYNLPNRDCGSYSGGGAASKASYLGWIERVSVATGQLPVMIILEPDALAEMECFNTQQQADLYDSLRQAVYILKRNSRAAVYLDAGHPHWQSAATMVGRLNIGGIAAADGFSLNVSNFIPTTENIMYGLQISAALGGKHFVIDTSRNGAGSNGEWCNPPGRALGAAPTARTGVPLADAFLWIKTPGESDGDCGRGEPVAGVWWPDYALGLAQRAGY